MERMTCVDCSAELLESDDDWIFLATGCYCGDCVERRFMMLERALALGKCIQCGAPVRCYVILCGDRFCSQCVSAMCERANAKIDHLFELWRRLRLPWPN